MTVRHFTATFSRLDDKALAAWQEVGTAEASDCLNRSMAMQGAIGPLSPEMKLVGHARTVSCMVADNSALHAALTTAEPGDVLVAAAQGFEDVAVWGGLMTRAAMEKDIAGLIIDGAVRDSAEIIELGFPCFARNAVPRGPHKGFGGTVNETIACGGVAVSPGDLILGDADGVTVIPHAKINDTLKAAHALQAREASALEKMKDGTSLAEIYGVPAIEFVED